MSTDTKDNGGINLDVHVDPLASRRAVEEATNRRRAKREKHQGSGHMKKKVIRKKVREVKAKTRKEILSEVWRKRVLGRFQLLGLLGKGSMGAVFRAEDTQLKRQVALKVLPLKSRPGVIEKDVEQFIREARSGAIIEHPNITQVFEIGEEGGLHYIAMEMVQGGDLRKRVRAEGPLDFQEACELTAQAAEAIHAAHQQGIVHRDIKPSNLLMTIDNKMKVTDFGLARIDDPEDEFSLPSELVGTPKYLAPEVCIGNPHTEKTDMYSLGACLWFLLAGSAPFNDPDPHACMEKHVKEQLPDIRKLRPDLPRVLIKALYKTLEKNPNDRYEHLGQLAEVLRNVAQADDLMSLASAVDETVIKTGYMRGHGSNSSGSLGRRSSRSASSSTLGKPITTKREINAINKREKQYKIALIALGGIAFVSSAVAIAVGIMYALSSSGG